MNELTPTISPIQPGDDIFCASGSDGPDAPADEVQAFTVTSTPVPPERLRIWDRVDPVPGIAAAAAQPPPETRADVDADRRAKARARRCKDCNGRGVVSRQAIDPRTRVLLRGAPSAGHPRGTPVLQEVTCRCAVGQGDPGRRSLRPR